MRVSKKVKMVLFIVGLIIGVLFLIMGIGVMDETALIRLEGSEL